MLEIGIVGYGIVGQATARTLEKHTTIKRRDPEKGYDDDVSNCDIIFICINEKDIIEMKKRIIAESLIFQPVR